LSTRRVKVPVHREVRRKYYGGAGTFLISDTLNNIINNIKTWGERLDTLLMLLYVLPVDVRSKGLTAMAGIQDVDEEFKQKILKAVRSHDLDPDQADYILKEELARQRFFACLEAVSEYIHGMLFLTGREIPRYTIESQGEGSGGEGEEEDDSL
jgi:hypothetical protein